MFIDIFIGSDTIKDQKFQTCDQLHNMVILEADGHYLVQNAITKYDHFYVGKGTLEADEITKILQKNTIDSFKRESIKQLLFPHLLKQNENTLLSIIKNSVGEAYERGKEEGARKLKNDLKFLLT